MHGPIRVHRQNRAHRPRFVGGYGELYGGMECWVFNLLTGEPGLACGFCLERDQKLPYYT